MLGLGKSDAWIHVINCYIIFRNNPLNQRNPWFIIPDMENRTQCPPLSRNRIAS